MKKRVTRVLMHNSIKKITASKRSALELSIGTIVIIVLSMSMLILGMVLVRSIMCGAVNLVKLTEEGVKGEIDKLFQSGGGKVVCIGSGEKPVTLMPGGFATLYCGINAEQTAEYNIKVTGLSGGILKEKDLEKWVVGDGFWKGNIAPGDEKPKKFLKLDVPETAPQDLITVDVEVYEDGDLISTQQLDFEIRRVGFFRAAVC